MTLLKNSGTTYKKQKLLNKEKKTKNGRLKIHGRNRGKKSHQTKNA